MVQKSLMAPLCHSKKQSTKQKKKPFDLPNNCLYVTRGSVKKVQEVVRLQMFYILYRLVRSVGSGARAMVLIPGQMQRGLDGR